METKKNRNSMFQSLQQFDKFPETVKLNYDGGKVFFKSYTGLLLTLLWVVIILGYAMQRLLVMISLQRITINEHLKYSVAAGTDQPFGIEQNLTFAFGFSDFLKTDGSNDQFADYGSMNAYYESWNATDDVFIPIKSRPCIKDDFHLGVREDYNSKFFAPFEKVDEFERKLNSLKCIDEPLNLLGNFNTQIA